MEPRRTLVAETEPVALLLLLLLLVVVWVLRVAVLQAGVAERSPEGGLVLVAAPDGAAPPPPLLQPQPQPPSRARSRASSPSVRPWPLEVSGARMGGHLPRSWAWGRCTQEQHPGGVSR